MSIKGFLTLLRGNPQHPVGEDGRMALSDHLRELRARLMKSFLFLFVVFIIGLFFTDELLNLTGQDYRLSPINLHPETRREPTFTAQLRFQF